MFNIENLWYDNKKVTKKLLIFGSTGNIGNNLFNYYNSRDDVTVYEGFCNKFRKEKEAEFLNISEKKENINKKCINIDDITENINFADLIEICKFDGIIWAQGQNINDNINSFNTTEFIDIINANVSFILYTLSILTKKCLINKNANLIIVSSIWETNLRPNKLSYSISKTALSSLVKSVAHELSFNKIKINNILPSIIDNEMTRETVDENTLYCVKKLTGFNRLIDINDIINTTNFLLFNNTGISGQSIKIDLGMTNIINI